VFLTGFVFQLSHLFFASSFLMMFAIEGGTELLFDSRFVWVTGGLLVNIVCSAAALTSWRILRAIA
jgi:hypothetical protein